MHKEVKMRLPLLRNKRRPARGKYNLGKVPSSYDVRR